MRRRKNLERAIVLGLLLSTSVYGNVWAADLGAIADDTILQESYDEDVNINGGAENGIQINNDGTVISIKTKEPLKSGTGTITISSNHDAIYINSNGSIKLNAVGDNIIKADLIGDPSNKNTASGIWADANASGSIELNGKNNSITVTGAGMHGIFTSEKNNNTNIQLNAINGNNTIEAGHNAIYHRGNGSITITANNGGNILSGGEGSAIVIDDSGIITIEGKYNEISSDSYSGINLTGDGMVSVTATDGNNVLNSLYANSSGSITVEASVGSNQISGEDAVISANGNATISIYAEKDNKIEGVGDSSKGIHTEGNGNISVIANMGSNTVTGSGVAVLVNNKENLIKAYGNNEITGGDLELALGSGVNSSNGGLEIVSTNGDNIIKGGYLGIMANMNDTINVIANNGKNDITSFNASGSSVYAQYNSKITLNAINNIITSNCAGVRATDLSQVTLAAAVGNTIEAETYGIDARSAANINLTTTQGINKIDSNGRGIYSTDESTIVKLEAVGNTIEAETYGIDARSTSDVSLTTTSLNNKITSQGYGIYSASNSKVTLNAQTDNIVSGKTNYGLVVNSASADFDADVSNQISSSENMAIYAYKNAIVDLDANVFNTVYAGELINYDSEYSGGIYGSKKAIDARSGSIVTFDAGEANTLFGAVYAKDAGTTIDIKGLDNTSSQYNDIRSAASITKAGGLTDTTVISALYAEAGAQINVSGANNTIMTYYSEPTDDTTSERVIWAYDGADIAVDGKTTISTAMYDESPNNMDIAIAAGTATGLDKDDFTDEVLADLDIATVTLNYENNGESKSSITGDILSAYGGVVDIKAKESLSKAVSDSGINIYGNLLAGNTGVLNVDIGKGSILTGRADDYGDANVEGTTHGAGKDNGGFFNPAFSSEIITGGEVNLTMGEGSTWNVTGQSWITELNTNGTINDTYIDLVNAKTDLNTNASALTIGTLNGDTTFHMNLDGNRRASDMLYIKNADGKYQIDLAKAVTNDDINKDGFDGLRFATVGTGSNVEFTVGSYDDGGAFNVEYTVDTDSYEGNTENTAYNSTTDGSANVEKPGNASVDDFFGLTNNAVEDDSEIATNGIMLMAENEEAADNAANANSGLDEVTNFKIIARADEELNDTGETILNMSRANYSNAIYMDRLNKRLGEARYINDDPEEDEGMWVRIRHDRIGKDDAYRSQNTMYELGYDKKQDCDNGERRVGFAVDYMHGDTGYTDIAGKGEIDRYGLWLYDTWMGDKGHYVDYVAKWGHLDNDFEVYTMRNGDKVTGDYSNNVFSVSTEYGRKKDIGNDWYFEPQAQLQLARVTGADYITNQGTKVSVDGINSLIGRAGFRIGKDFGEEKQSTLYFKADVLHEFLGDQDVYVMDKSTDNKWAGISYDNEGTWYDIGIGYAAMMSKSSYAFIDLEQSFGNDNDDTYQINAGVRWTF